MKMKATALIVAIMMVLLVTPRAVRAAVYAVADGQTLDIGTGALTQTEGGALVDTYAISDGDTIHIASGATATIKGSRKVMIACGAGASLTVQDATCDMSEVDDACALSFTGAGNTLVLNGTSSFKSGANAPGIRVEDGCTLTISGSGSITATGGDYSAGIGGGNERSAGTITIAGGSVTAIGGQCGAGMGSGDGETAAAPQDLNGGDITITGGTVTATGNQGAGIGGGDDVAGGSVTIDGGTVVATGGHACAGIGSGGGPLKDPYSDGGTIIINGGSVTATGGEYAAGMGGGICGAGGIITITGGRVTATGGKVGAGIGGGWHAKSGGTIRISDGDVTASGGGNNGGGAITITGGTVSATGGNDAAGIGTGHEGSDEDVIAIGEDAIVFAKGGAGGAGIGCGAEAAAPAITISGGSVTATGGENGAGIGQGQSSRGGTLAITGGIIYATGDTQDVLTYGSDGKRSFSISGPAAVLLGTDSVSPNPVAISHGHYIFNEAADQVYGIPVPEGWGTPFGAYLYLCELGYDANGGSGNAPKPVTQAAPSSTKAAANPFTYDGHAFTGWNTKADGSGKKFSPGDTLTLTGKVTLYAQWYAPVRSVTLSEHKITLSEGASLQLAATITPEKSGAALSWKSSDASVATVTGGKVLAIKAGSAVITAAAEDKTDTCIVVVKEGGPNPTPTRTPAPTEKTEATVEEEAEETQDGETANVTIHTAGLPKGTAAIFLPDGRVVKLTGDGDIVIEIDPAYLPNGKLQIIPLGEANKLMGVYTADGEAVFLPDAEDDGGWNYALMWTLIIIAGAGAAGFILWKKFVIRKP